MIVEKFMIGQSKKNEDVRQSLRNQQSVIQNLERDVDKIAKILVKRPVGELPQNTQANPRWEPLQKSHVNVITTQNEGKVSSVLKEVSNESNFV